MATAGISARWQALNMSFSRAAPSSMEYSVCTCRCTKDLSPLAPAAVTKNRLLQACANALAGAGTGAGGSGQRPGTWPDADPASRAYLASVIVCDTARRAPELGEPA